MKKIFILSAFFALASTSFAQGLIGDWVSKKTTKEDNILQEMVVHLGFKPDNKFQADMLCEFTAVPIIHFKIVSAGHGFYNIQNDYITMQSENSKAETAVLELDYGQNISDSQKTAAEALIEQYKNQLSNFMQGLLEQPQLIRIKNSNVIIIGATILERQGSEGKDTAIVVSEKQLEEPKRGEALSGSQEGEDTNTIYTTVEEQPSFPTGYAGLMSYIKNNLIYPKYAAENGIQGRVTLYFVVEKDGEISNIEIMRTPSEELSKEAIRLVTSMPKWKPGKNKGKPVRTKYLLPISFTLQ